MKCPGTRRAMSFKSGLSYRLPKASRRHKPFVGYVLAGSSHLPVRGRPASYVRIHYDDQRRRKANNDIKKVLQVFWCAQASNFLARRSTFAGVGWSCLGAQ
jgi:hypothetical protein